MEMLWADSFVEEANLPQNVAVLRKTLGEDPKTHRFIVTIPGRGYRFVANVKKQGLAAPDQPESIQTEALLSHGSAVPGRAIPTSFQQDKGSFSKKRKLVLGSGLILLVVIVAIFGYVGFWRSSQTRGAQTQ